MKRKDSVKTISVSLASSSVCGCLYVWGQLSGSEKGYFYGVFPPPAEFPVHGGFYENINGWYCIIAAGFCIYVAGKLLLPNAAVSNIVCILGLSVGLYPYWEMFIYKRAIIALETFNELTAESRLPYFQWLKLSVYFDWFLLLSALILLVAQITSMITSKLNQETLKIN